MNRAWRVSDARKTRWQPATAAERRAVWQLSWRWTTCGKPRCKCAAQQGAKHGPYLDLRLPDRVTGYS